MKIVVANESEARLMRDYLTTMHELGIIDLMEEEDGSHPDEQVLNANDYRAIRDAVAGDQIKVVVDAEEDDICYEDNDFIVGTCIRCGTETQGLIDPETVTYERYLKMMDNQKDWHCYECQRKQCQGE
ncbi:hypothetical protein [Paenibacillus dendritiformis]|uniref:hypothetical protein n=1 Tax=Paenibacillus dendritiformis TaxID=130049 RepID=UPI000DA9E5A9|nr:hypothetical protein [Paenibacillus dendritiformis]PZM62593.1 hypothetical protein DOE73_26410 [Paenibacillus dendritiformis]